MKPMHEPRILYTRVVRSLLLLVILDMQQDRGKYLHVTSTYTAVLAGCTLVFPDNSDCTLLH